MYGADGVQYAGIRRMMDQVCFRALSMVSMMVAVALTAASTAYALSVPLTVTENAGITRTAEPVTSGVPIPSNLNLLSTGSLGVFSGSAAVPAQFKVLARWGGAPDDTSKPIKWVLVDFHATVTANSSGVYTLTDTGNGTTGTGMTVTNGASSIIVNTGEAIFTISKTQFNLFDSVVLKDPSTGQLTRTILSSLSTAGASITRASNGTVYYAGNQTTSVTVEDQGPLHTVILATGRHQDGSGASLFDWKVRMYFHHGKSYAKVFYTIVDKQDGTNITGNIPLSQMTLLSKLTLSGTPSYVLAGNTGTTSTFTGTLGASQTESLLQTGTISDAPGRTSAVDISYALSGVSTGSGQWSRGWADLSDGNMGLTVAVRYFWQLYPKQFRLSGNGSVNIDLWPSNATPLLMWTAAQKTHEMLYYFHNGSAAAAGSEGLVNSLFGIDTSHSAGVSRHHNLFATAPPLWYAQSRALGDIGIRSLASYPASHQVLVTKYFNNVDAVLTASLNKRDNGAFGGGHEYMFWNFGDSEDNAWSNGAYDTPRADAIHFAASGDRKFLDHMNESMQHWRDVDVEHSILDIDPSESSRVGWNGGSAPWLGRSKYNPSGARHGMGQRSTVTFNLGHLKGHGLATHYFLTGDSLSKDVLAETYNYYRMWNTVQIYNNWGETRVWSNMLAIMIGNYEVFGTAEAKSRADSIVTLANAYQRRNTAPTNPGLIWVSGSSGISTSGFINGHTRDILLNYMIHVPGAIDETQNIIDSVTFEINTPELWNGSYFNCWTSDNYGVNNATVCDYMTIGGYGFAYSKLLPTNPTLANNILSIAKTALSNAISQDSTTTNLKAYTQKTRIPPGFFYYLMLTGGLSGDATPPAPPTGVTVQ